MCVSPATVLAVVLRSQMKQCELRACLKHSRHAERVNPKVFNAIDLSMGLNPGHVFMGAVLTYWVGSSRPDTADGRLF